MNRVIHFEIHAEDPRRAAEFYKNVFGWEIKEWVLPGVEMKEEDRYWVVTTGSEEELGINGGIMFRRGSRPAADQPVNAYVCTVGVASLDESVDKVMKAGGSIATPKMPVKEVGWLAYCKDTEGNLFGIIQEDKDAK